MKSYLLSTSLLSYLIQGKKPELLVYLENLLGKDSRFYTTAMSLFEILQVMDWNSREEQKEFLNQSGILCEEVFPVTQEDIQMYLKTTSEEKGWKGMEWVEICLAINRNMDAVLVYGSGLLENPWIPIIDLKNKIPHQ